MLSFKDLMERINETRSLYLEEEVEGLDENFDSNSKAHQAAKAATKGWKAKNSKATYHPDGTATIHTNTAHSMPAHAFGHHTGVETRHSHEVVNAHLKNAGGEHGHSRDELGSHEQKINGVNWKVKGKSQSHEIHLSEGVEGLDYDLFESIMLGEGDLSIRTLYNKYADHALGAGDKPEPKKAAAVKKAIVKVHGSTVMGHLEKAKNAAAKNDQDSEAHHFDKARSSAKSDTIGATVGKNRSSMRKEEVDLDESRMKDLAMDMESLSHVEFKKKHKRTKQEMQSSLKSEELKGSQHKIDANKNGKVDGHDFKILRNAKKARYQ
jgi:hypothetical protein